MTFWLYWSTLQKALALGWSLGRFLAFTGSPGLPSELLVGPAEPSDDTLGRPWSACGLPAGPPWPPSSFFWSTLGHPVLRNSHIFPDVQKDGIDALDSLQGAPRIVAN